MKKIINIILVATLSIFMISCFESKTENKIEDIGEKIEETTEDAADKVEDATDSLTD